MPPHTLRHDPTPARLEAFSDGVIAVIITIMVLEIKVPRANGVEGLRELLPHLLVYLLSFAFTGIYWLNHQNLVRRTEHAGHAMQCANLGFLFCLSLLPLSTAYVVEKDLAGLPVALYAASLLITALAFLGLRLTVHRHLRRESGMDASDRYLLNAHLFSMTIYVLGIAAAFTYPKIVLAVIAVLTLVWMLPNRRLQST